MEDRRAILEALAKGGSAGVAAYRDAKAKAKDAESAAIADLLASAGAGDYLGIVSPAGEARLAGIVADHTAAARTEAGLAGDQWDDQVGYENLAIGKFLGDARDEIADLYADSDRAIALDRERARLDDEMRRTRDSYMERIAASEGAAATPGVPDLGAYDDLLRDLGRPPGKNLGRL